MRGMLMRLVATVMLASGLSAVGAAPTDTVATFRGRLASLVQPTSASGSTMMVSSDLRIEIRRWSTDVERQTLVSAIASGQPSALMAVLKAPRPAVGRLVLTGPLLFGNEGNEPVSTDIYYAAESRHPDGVRQVILLVRSTEQVADGLQPVGRRPGEGLGPTDWVELEVQPDGTGRGNHSFACQLGVNQEGNDIALRAPGNRVGVITLLK